MSNFLAHGVALLHELGHLTSIRVKARCDGAREGGAALPPVGLLQLLFKLLQSALQVAVLPVCCLAA